MKNLILVLFFMMVGSFAFANESNENMTTTNSSSINQSSPLAQVTQYRVSSIEYVSVESCKVTLDITITMGGTTTTIKGTFVVEGQSCAELLKEMIK